MLTRFALCATTHYIAAKRLLQSENPPAVVLGVEEEAALAVGAAIATAIAVFKNKAFSSPKKRFVPTSEAQPTHTTTPEPQTQSHTQPHLRVGGFDVVFETLPLGGVAAYIVLNGKKTSLKGTSVKGRNELSKVPSSIVSLLEERLDSVDPTSRKVFDVYRSLRDELQL